MKNIKTNLLIILMAFATMPVWAMDAAPTVISYSDASKDLQESAAHLMKEEFCKEIEDPSEQIMLLIKDAHFIGAVIYRNTQAANRMVEHLAIEPEHRDQGHARYLMQCVEDDAKKLNLKAIMLDCRAETRDFYLRLGFKSYLPYGLSLYKTLRHVPN